MLDSLGGGDVENGTEEVCFEVIDALLDEKDDDSEQDLHVVDVGAADIDPAERNSVSVAVFGGEMDDNNDGVGASLSSSGVAGGKKFSLPVRTHSLG